MSTPISIVTAEHYRWGDTCDGWHLVHNQEISVIEERMPPGTSEVRHYHRAAWQFFYVLAGVATLEAAGTQHMLRAGEGIEVSPGVPHQIANTSDTDTRFLVISRPPSHGDRILAE